MAKGNMLLGYSRGAVGDLVFARSKGQQVARARNRNPNNPNTEAQVLQRSRFAGALRFFKLANDNFFKFAYEDKAAHESDYNAFMRHNVKIAPYILKEMTQRADYPAFAPWVVTAGSLPTVDYDDINYYSDVNKWGVTLWGGILPATAGTVAGLTTYLQSIGDYRDGDILTFIAQTAIYGEYPLPVTSGTSDYPHYHSNFMLYQIVLDSTDPRNVSDLVEGYTRAGAMWYVGEGLDEHAAVSCAIIHSRNATNGLQVSTQTMLLNNNQGLEGAAQSYRWTCSDAYIPRILTSWSAAAPAILQGAKASAYVIYFNSIAYIAGGQEIPVNVGGNIVTSETSLTLVLSGARDGAVTESDFAANGATISNYDYDGGVVNMQLTDIRTAARGGATLSYKGMLLCTLNKSA